MTTSEQTSQTAAAHKAHPSLLPRGFLRLHHVLAVFPVSKSAWYAGVKSGRYPASVKLSERTIAWKIEDIRALIEKYGSAERDHDKR